MELYLAVASIPVTRKGPGGSWEFPIDNPYSSSAQRCALSEFTPSNGREFTADDVLFHYHRFFTVWAAASPNPVLTATRMSGLKT